MSVRAGTKKQCLWGLCERHRYRSYAGDNEGSPSLARASTCEGWAERDCYSFTGGPRARPDGRAVGAAYLWTGAGPEVRGTNGTRARLMRKLIGLAANSNGVDEPRATHANAINGGANDRCYHGRR